MDRSLANDEFNLDFDMGVDLYAEDLLDLDLLRYDVGLFLGRGRNNFELDTPDLLFASRLEIFPLGLFAHTDQADLEHSNSPHLSLGVAYAAWFN